MELLWVFNHMKNTKMREKIWGLSSPQRLCSGISAGTVGACLVVWKGQSVAGSRQPLGWMQRLFAGVPLCLVQLQPSVTKGCAAKYPVWLQTESDLCWRSSAFYSWKRWAWRRGEVLWWWVGAVWQMYCCSSASHDSAGGFWKSWSAGAITSHQEGENWAQWGYLNNLGWVYNRLVVLSLTPSDSVSCSRAAAVALHGLYLQISPKVWPAASCSSPKIICEHPKILLTCLCALLWEQQHLCWLWGSTQSLDSAFGKGKLQEKILFFLFILKWFNSIPEPTVHITETLTTAGTDVNFGDACSQRIWW